MKSSSEDIQAGPPLRDRPAIGARQPGVVEALAAAPSSKCKEQAETLHSPVENARSRAMSESFGHADVPELHYVPELHFSRDRSGLYVYLTPAAVASTLELGDGVNVDLDRQGRAVGVEVITSLVPVDTASSFTPETGKDRKWRIAVEVPLSVDLDARHELFAAVVAVAEQWEADCVDPIADVYGHPVPAVDTDWQHLHRLIADELRLAKDGEGYEPEGVARAIVNTIRFGDECPERTANNA